MIEENQIWAEVVTIGSELVLGQLLDTNARYIASALSEIGIGLAYHTTVGDDFDRMKEVLRTALDRCQVVITTGGLGPTEDDLTREAVAEVIGKPLVLRPELVERIEGFFKRIGAAMAPNNRKQANIPEGGEPIDNPRGTAPGVRYEYEDRTIICLPGVPAETEPLIREAIIPYLKQKYSPKGRLWVNRVLKVCGEGESNVDFQIKEIIKTSKNPIIGLQASPGEIKVRLTARADNSDEANIILDRSEFKIRQIIGPLIFGYGEETLPGNTAREINRKGWSLGIAEAVTRGKIVAALCPLLDEGLFKGGMVLSEPESAETLCKKVFDEYRSDVALAVSGLPDADDQMRIEILAMHRDGRKMAKDYNMGAASRVFYHRAVALGLYTLFRFLKD